MFTVRERAQISRKCGFSVISTSLQSRCQESFSTVNVPSAELTLPASALQPDWLLQTQPGVLLSHIVLHQRSFSEKNLGFFHKSLHPVRLMTCVNKNGGSFPTSGPQNGHSEVESSLFLAHYENDWLPVNDSISSLQEQHSGIHKAVWVWNSGWILISVFKRTIWPRFILLNLFVGKTVVQWSLHCKPRT